MLTILCSDWLKRFNIFLSAFIIEKFVDKTKQNKTKQTTKTKTKTKSFDLAMAAAGNFDLGMAAVLQATYD